MIFVICFTLFFIFFSNFHFFLFFFTSLIYNKHGDSMKNKSFDLSDIKENDLESTSSFVDLMSRSERKNHMKKKKSYEEKQKELKEILFEDENNKVKNTKKDNKRKEQLNKIAKSDIDDKPKVKLENTTKFKEFKDEVTSSVYDNLEDNINKNKDNKYGIGNIIIIGIFIILSLTYYIYSILFTNIQTNDTYLLIEGVIILSMITFFCISIVCGKILYRILSVLNYLIFIGFIVFNILLIFKIKI